MLVPCAAKIADVGLARFITDDQATQKQIMGTVAWAAPELLRYDSIDDSSSRNKSLAALQ